MTAEKEEISSSEKEQVLVVGLGGSAGGLQALKGFFKSLPEQTGMAFIVVLHLAPNKKSNLAEILESVTALDVAQVSGKTYIEPDHVYVIPPDRMLSVEDNHLVLSKPEKKHGMEAINLLFQTLAEKKGQYAAGIILSGSGTDGTSGLKAIKKQEGFCLVQDPEEAANSSMPHSAIKNGMADKVLPVSKMAEELIEYQRTFSDIRLPAEPVETRTRSEDTEKNLLEILAKVREKIGHDFGNYRRSSIFRRINRRMRVNHVSSLEQYNNYLERYPEEVDELFKDLLISVTSFFRDPESFKALEEQVIPGLFKDKTKNDQIRVWVPGCATGEEAYSVGMLLLEYFEQIDSYPRIKVFASDVDEEALKAARQGCYPKSIESDVSEERLRRFFNENGSEYKVKKELKETILFANHDLLRNAPFSNQDLIVCRNVLIYLNRELQEEVFNLFYYSLRPSGWLFLGKSDSRIGTEGLFKIVDQKHHLYQQKPSSRSHSKLPDLPLLYKFRSNYRERETPTQRKKNIEKMHLRILARTFAPKSVLIDEDYNVIHATEGINQYLEYGGGEPSRNILEMVKPKIRQLLRVLLFKLDKEKQESSFQKANVSLQDKTLEISVGLVKETDFEEGLIHVVFKENDEAKLLSAGQSKLAKEDIAGREAEIIEGLENELEYTKEQLHTSIQQYETSNEELKTSNEELQSMNEELQSTTEELETSKEELQSVNEELETVNEELENKVQELSRANNDMKNMMEATEVGIIFLDEQLKVYQFTQSSTLLFNLIPSDEGRPFSHITNSLSYDHLMEDLKEIQQSQKPTKKLVESTDGREYIMRIRLYRSTEEEVKGVVLSFTEVTELRKSQKKVEENLKRESSLLALCIYLLEQDDLSSIFKRAIDLACVNLDVDCTVFYSLEKERNMLQLSEQEGCAKEHEALELNDHWDIGFAIQKEEVTIVTDYEEEERFAISPFLEGEGIVSSVHVVVRGTEETYGLMGFYCNTKRRFSEQTQNFMKILSNLIGLAIQQNNSQKDLKDEVKRSKRYQQEILHNSIVERWDLGGYLHDDLAQLLVSAKITLQNIKARFPDDAKDILKEINSIIEIIDDGVTGIRNLTHEIIPVDIEAEGVKQAFRILLRQLAKNHNIKYTLKTDEIIEKVKDRELATNLYHVIQEAVKNAAIHGKAQKVKIVLEEKDKNLRLQITDDGLGLSNTSRDRNQIGSGINIMRHRMELLGGSFTIEKNGDSGKNGTRVSCTVPLEFLEDENE